MEKKNLLIGFYDKPIDKYLDKLNKFDESGYTVHVFDNLNNETLDNLDIKEVLFNTFEGKIDNSSVNIISNNEKFILNIFKRYGFQYNAFIFDNTISMKSNMKIDNFQEYMYSNNLYSLNIWVNNKMNYSILKDCNLYDLTKEQILNYINSATHVFKNLRENIKYYDKLEIKSKRIKNYIITISQNKQEEYEKIFIKNAYKNKDILYQIYINSFLLYTFKKATFGEIILDLALSFKGVNEETEFFIMYQLIAKSFTDSKINSSLNENKMDTLYEDIFQKYKREIGELSLIPKNERNENFIVVFISQFLTMEHGPTKTVLDRCYALKKYLNKEVLLINTTELITSKGMVLMNDMGYGNKMDSYTNLKKVPYKDIDINYYQPQCDMPDLNECKKIIDLIKRDKPYLLFNIGGYSITADLAAQIIPMATISTSGNYAISKNKGNFFIMGRKAEEGDYKIAEQMGQTRESIIETPFTFTVKEQENNYTREKYEIPKDKFVVATIGARLEREITEEFLKYANILAENGCYIVTIGEWKFPKDIAEKYPMLNKNFKGLGFQSDILACIDLIDIYINPKRQGGGSSAVECMYKGKPALSLKYGDVSELVDNEFVSDTYDQMVEQVLKCKNSVEYYNKLSEKAKKRAEYFMDTKTHFVNMYNNIINSAIFK